MGNSIEKCLPNRGSLRCLISIALFILTGFSFLKAVGSQFCSSSSVKEFFVVELLLLLDGNVTDIESGTGSPQYKYYLNHQTQ